MDKDMLALIIRSMAAGFAVGTIATSLSALILGLSIIIVGAIVAYIVEENA